MAAVLSLDPHMKETKKKPGPGTYEPSYNTVKKKEAYTKFGSEVRRDLSFEKMKLFQQDPGTYNPNSSATKLKASEWRFGTEQRPSMVQKGLEKVPGPNVYSLPSKLVEGPQCSMHAKTDLVDQVKKKNIPGPGTYNLQDSPNMNHSIQPAYRMGSSTRPELSGGKETSMKPGPGTYD